MKMKILFWISMLLLNIPLAFAQTGLFDSGNAGTFATTGITIIIIIIVGMEAFRRFFKKK